MKNKAFVTIVCSCLTAVIVIILFLAAPTGVSAQCEIVWEGFEQQTCLFYDLIYFTCIPYGPSPESGSMPTEEVSITHAAAEERSGESYPLGDWIERFHDRHFKNIKWIMWTVLEVKVEDPTFKALSLERWGLFLCLV